jgi:hypothetical protein
MEGATYFDMDNRPVYRILDMQIRKLYRLRIEKQQDLF